MIHDLVYNSTSLIWPAQLTVTFGLHNWPSHLACTTDRHIWPAQLTVTFGLHNWPSHLACTTDHHIWPAQLTITFGLHNWPSHFPFQNWCRKKSFTNVTPNTNLHQCTHIKTCTVVFSCLTLRRLVDPLQYVQYLSIQSSNNIHTFGFKMDLKLLYWG